MFRIKSGKKSVRISAGNLSVPYNRMNWENFYGRNNNYYNDNYNNKYNKNNNRRFYNSNNNEKNVNEFSDEDLNALEVNVDRLLNLVKKYPGDEKMPGNLQLPLKEGQKYKTVAEPKKVFGKLPAHLQGGKSKKARKPKRKTRKHKQRKN